MAEGFEERLQDLERLVLKQVERIEELESQLVTVRRLSRLGDQAVAMPGKKSQAA